MLPSKGNLSGFSSWPRFRPSGTGTEKKKPGLCSMPSLERDVIYTVGLNAVIHTILRQLWALRTRRSAQCRPMKEGSRSLLSNRQPQLPNTTLWTTPLF